MSATSSNQAVVPDANIVFSGTAPNCTATVTATSTGSTNITYTVADGAGGSANTGNTVTGLTAGQVVVSQNLSTATVTANASINSSTGYIITNEVATIRVTVRDTNNVVLGGGHWVQIVRGAGTSNGTLSAVTDHGDGTYTATFRGTTIGTARTFNAYINGYPITSTMPQITVSSVAPNCLSYRNVGSSISGVYNLDADGDAGAQPSFQAYCDMVTNGGGWTLAAVPRKGVTPMGEVPGLLSPAMTVNARNSNVWASTSQFRFSQIRVTDDAAATHYSVANFNATQSISSLLSNYTVYSQNNVLVGSAVTNSFVSSNIGSTCFVFRGKSANVTAWSDAADYIFMGFHGGAGCAVPLNLGNNWDTTNITQQWLISGYDGLNSVDGPEGTNGNVGQNMTGTDWVNQDYSTLIWLR